MANGLQGAHFTPRATAQLVEDIPSQDSPVTCETHGGDEGGPPTVKKPRRTETVINAENPCATFCIFTDMPFDILFEICQYLRPGQLVDLCDASPVCWRMLCTKSAAFVWVNCRELDDLYDIPDGMTEYYWAKLFYSTRCMECDFAKARTPSFYMRRRLCDNCHDSKCITRGDFVVRFGNKVEVLDYVRSTEFRPPYAARYNEDDIVEQLRTLSPLNEDVLVGKRGAYRKLQRYKASRKKLLLIMQAEAQYFDRCHRRESERVIAQEEKEIDRQYQEIHRRFFDLGYLPKDFRHSTMHRHHQLLHTTDELTDARWKRIRDEYEPKLQANKIAREKRERDELMLDRRILLDDSYVVHKLKRVTPSQWKFLPQIHNLMILPPFRDLIECDKNRSLTKDDFEPLLKRLDQIVGPEYEEAKTRLRDQVLGSAVPLYADLTTLDKFQNLELAILVFRCTHCRLILFAWDELRSHYCVNSDLILINGQIRLGKQPAVHLEDFDGDFPYSFELCEHGGEAVSLILHLLRLKPADTTPVELDASDTRFSCVHKSNNSTTTFNWRGLVAHLVSHHTRQIKDKTMPLPKKITSRNRHPDINSLKRTEDKIVNEYALWACAKCDTHLASGRLTKPAGVRAHLKEHHDTPQPQEGVDYVDLSDYTLFANLAREL